MIAPRLRHRAAELQPDTIRSIVVVLLSLTVVGVSYGAIAHQAGMPTWLTVGMAFLLLAGSSEILFVGMIMTGSAPIVAAIAGILVNTRNFAYGMHASTFLRPGPSRLLAAHIANDEGAALAVIQPTTRARRTAYWITGSAIIFVWPMSSWLGTVVGGLIEHPDMLGLDAAMPAMFFAFISKAVREDAASRAAAITGGVIALATTPFVPAGVSPVLGLAGMFAGWYVDRRRAPRASTPEVDPVTGAITLPDLETPEPRTGTITLPDLDGPMPSTGAIRLPNEEELHE
ncbi:AzlC family ABC transporter permease [Pseudoclavibacter albus]|uniref:AzlC family ABC transporter permease n=1 Tax=Pseudoclavibacter albus TaxID=272241 RepID=UPI000825739E|nr:AzlC family ABC transporter permease [Pseudoclavibacter alba]